MIVRRWIAALMCAAIVGVGGATAQDAKPAASPANSSAPPTLAAFAALPVVVHPVLSPDGTRVATRIAIKGQLRLAIIPVGDVQKTVLIAPGNSDLNDWQWVNNQWLVVRAGAMSQVDGENWYVRRVIAVSADGTKMNALGKDIAGQIADDILWVARDGSPRLLLALQTSIYSNEPGFWPEVRNFDVSTGKSIRVQGPTQNVMDWYADTGGTVRLGIAYDDIGKSWRALYRANASSSFRTIDRARGPNAQLGTLPSLLTPASDKSIAVDDTDGFDAVYNFDLTTMKIGEKLFGIAGYDIDGPVVDPSGTRLLGVRYTDTAPRTHWLDPTLAAVQADLDRAVGDRQPQIVSWSNDLSILIVHLGGPMRGGAYYTYRPAEGRMSLFVTLNPELGNKPLAPVSTIRYKARDGVEMSAVLTLPKGRAAKDLPLILMPHGGPFARDDEEWDWWAQFLASRGYAVLQPNYRGSAGYGTEFARRGRGQWGLAMQDDLTDAVNWAAKQGIADPKRVCIVGASYGGYAAFRAAQRDKGVYRCAVSYAGVSDLSAMLRYNSSFLNSGRSNAWLKLQAPDLKSVSPINFAGDFSIPILIMHGKADQRVPVKQSREMVERLKALGKIYRYVEQPEGDHHFSREADRLQFLQELEAFLTKYNPS